MQIDVCVDCRNAPDPLPKILHALRTQEHTMSVLSDKIDQLVAAEAKLDTDITTAIADFKSQIGAGQPVTAADLDRLSALVSSAGTTDATVTAADPGAPATTPPPAPTDVPPSPAPVDVPPAEPAPTADARPVYTFTGDPITIDASTWPSAGFAADGLTPLYHYAGDVTGQPAAGDNLGGVWHLFTPPAS